ncbi:MAG: penicillin acylase family protein [Cellvibrionaceae bacterium]|nr:penicillin acylase family protein [Cellvibrionaceae bacterium]
MTIRNAIGLALAAIASSTIALNSHGTTAYQAEIRYTDYGVPHIKAKDYASLGYGVGYAQARENLCTLAEQMLNLRAERARYLGAGKGKQNIIFDVAYKAWDLTGQAKAQMAKLSQHSRELLQGYSDGFNAQLRKRQSAADLPSPCRGAEWVKPISPEMLLAYQLDMVTLASRRAFLKAIVAAAPPSSEPKLSIQLDPSHVLTSAGIGSNGWALGSERVKDANSGLIANPHYPWDGELRFYQQHLTIPGVLDVTGVSMIGLPVVSIGFNKHVAWTHTVSQSKRFTLYQLELDPLNPLRYRYGDQYRNIEPKAVSIEVKQLDGSLKPYQHTVYQSHYGWLVNLGSINPKLGWSANSAIAMRDANHDNIAMVEQWLSMNQANNIDDMFAAFKRHHGIPWVNTIMVDSSGEAAYIDGTRAPALSPQAEAYWRKALQSPDMAALWRDGLGPILLPGNDPAYEWQNLADARSPGIVNFAMAPKLRRKDYVFNANSSHWLSHVEKPLEGYSIVYGPEQTHRSPRTRYNAQLISDTSPSGPAGADGKFTLAELQQVFTDNGSLFGKQLRSALLQRCTGVSQLQGYDLRPACQALQGWDGHYRLDSRGAQLMREFLAEYRVAGHRDLSDKLFAVGFDPRQAATSPRGLAAAPTSGPDPVLQALAKATKRLQQAGIALDARLGDIQYVIKAAGQAPIAVTGGYSYEGVFNYAQGRHKNRGHATLANVQLGQLSHPKTGSTLRSMDEDGDGKAETAYRVNYGSSFVMALVFGDNGPEAQMFLSYGQSHDPQSPHFRDQSELYKKLQWRPILFKEADIKANTQKTIKLPAP